MKKFIYVSNFFLFLGIMTLLAGPVDWIKDKSKAAIETISDTAKSGTQTVKDVATKGIEKVKSLTNDLLDIFKKFSTSEMKKQINDKNKYKDKVSNLRQESGMSQNEKQYINNRSKFVQNASQKIFGSKFNPNQQFGIVASGGGYRAMIVLAGFMKALEDLGWLDLMSYFSTLSGSTWYQAPWVMSSGSASAYLQALVDVSKAGKLNLSKAQNVMSGDVKVFIKDIVWPKFIFDQPIGSVDLYGALLAYVLFNKYGNERQRVQLSDQLDKIKDGTKPWPIYTSISMHKLNGNYIYNWYEFNPSEIVNLEINGKPEQGQNLYKFDTFAFGSKFDSGTSKEIAPPQSMGYILGFAGSAYNVNLKDLYKIIFDSADDIKLTGLDKIKFEVAEKIFKIAQNLKGIGTARFLPAQVNNPFINVKTVPSWLSNKDYLVFVDAGIDYNLPIRPLLLKNRNVKVIFVFDASATIDPASELPKMFADIKRVYNYNYSRVDDKSTKTLQFYKDEKNNQAPLIIYLNFIKDQKLIEQAQKDPALKKVIDDNNLSPFDALKCLQQDYCSTFNFDYNEKELKQLSGIAEFNVKANANTIKAFLTKELGL